MKHIPAQSVDTATPVTANASQRDSTTTSSTVISSSPLKRKREDANGNDDVDPADASSDDLASAIMSRDEMAKKEEDTGLLEFCVIRNDGTPDRMVQLMTLKNIFSKQLPKMPKEYIVRLVFDRNHHSMVILKNKKTVVGGICYRPFVANHFGEIAFCAITASEQVKGYGTRLMNHLKEYVKSQGLTHFLTYADNYAIGYFKKQGFSKVVSMPKPNWFGYIKDYDGGTLMECQIHHNINYLEITSMVHRQRSMILDEIKKRSKADIVYPGLTTFCDSRLVNIHAVPGVKEAGWSQTLIRSSRTSRDSSTLKQQLQSMWKSFSNHRSAWPFHEPVDVTVVTDYLDFVKHPIDLSTIQKKIDENLYATKAAFKDDLVLMCDNSMLYNAPDTNYYKYDHGTMWIAWLMDVLEQHDELAVSYAALILFDGEAEITSEALSTVIAASGNEVEPYWPTLFAGLLSKDGKMLELITSGGAIGGGAAAAPAAAAAADAGAAAPAKKEEKKEEEDADLGGGMDMFGGGSDY
ncbi:hypothetical protein DYB32_005496 [Aphanomyces invadans]|uniref:histone acetyltransferase n=1 Tax=Aphanomyces invadans TaxID=157072 RepID=A0A418AUD5_9STRA|nr:hypothetical protein DYB32_005496 [Aphanomyces invadans]